MVPEYLPGAEGSDQEFTALEKCNRDACNPRGATAYVGLQRVGLLDQRAVSGGGRCNCVQRQESSLES